MCRSGRPAAASPKSMHVVGELAVAGEIEPPEPHQLAPPLRPRVQPGQHVVGALARPARRAGRSEARLVGAEAGRGIPAAAGRAARRRCGDLGPEGVGRQHLVVDQPAQLGRRDRPAPGRRPARRPAVDLELLDPAGSEPRRRGPRPRPSEDRGRAACARRAASRRSCAAGRRDARETRASRAASSAVATAPTMSRQSVDAADIDASRARTARRSVTRSSMRIERSSAIVTSVTDFGAGLVDVAALRHARHRRWRSRPSSDGALVDMAERPVVEAGACRSARLQGA